MNFILISKQCETCCYSVRCAFSEHFRKSRSDLRYFFGTHPGVFPLYHRRLDATCTVLLASTISWTLRLVTLVLIDDSNSKVFVLLHVHKIPEEFWRSRFKNKCEILEENLEKFPRSHWDCLTSKRIGYLTWHSKDFWCRKAWQNFQSFSCSPLFKNFKFDLGIIQKRCLHAPSLILTLETSYCFIK